MYHVLKFRRVRFLTTRSRDFWCIIPALSALIENWVSFSMFQSGTNEKKGLEDVTKTLETLQRQCKIVNLVSDYLDYTQVISLVRNLTSHEGMDMGQISINEVASLL